MMAAPVNLVTVHHEGAGTPTTASNCARFAEGGYCCGIGTDGYNRFRSSWSNWATLNFNGQDWTPCLSGNRMTSQVTDNDIATIHNAFMDAYNRGEVTANPQVRAHRNSPGSSTVCPGDLTIARWNDVAAACSASTPTPKPPEPPKPTEIIVDLASAVNKDGRPEVYQVGGDNKLYNRWRAATGGAWSAWNPFSDGLTDFDTVTAWTNVNGCIEVWVTLKNGRTYSKNQRNPGTDWTSWTERTT